MFDECKNSDGTFKPEFYNFDYFENGKQSGKGWLEHYRFLPQRSFREAFAFIDYLGLNDKTDFILDFGCFVEGTKILLPDYKDMPIEKLNTGDSVLTHLGNIGKIINIFKRKTQTIRLKSLYSFEWETTKEHPFLVKRDNNIEFINAEHLQKGDFFAIPLNKKGKINEELFAEFLGFFLAEGNFLRCHGKASNFAATVFTFGIKEEEYALRVKFLGEQLECTSVTIKKRPERNTIDIQVFGKDLANRVYKYGGQYSDKKRLLLNEIMLWTDESKKLLISSWLKGDGYRQDRKNKGSVYYGGSISKELIEDIRKLSISVGVVPSFHKNKLYKNHKQSYLLAFAGTDINKMGLDGSFIRYTTRKRYKIDENYVYIPLISKEVGEEKVVYNIEVENDHTYFANGVPVHNCAKGFLVRAFRELGFKVQGCDISEYALTFAPQGCWNCASDFQWNFHKIMHYTHIVCKDVLEHLTEEQLHKTLIKLKTLANKMMVVVPMGNHGKYRIPEYHLEISHLIAENESWWEDAFKQAGWKVIKETNHVPGLKDNWLYEPYGNCVFVLETI